MCAQLFMWLYKIEEIFLDSLTSLSDIMIFSYSEDSMGLPVYKLILSWLSKLVEVRILFC